MSDKPKHWTDFGLKWEVLYDPSVSMPYWVQFLPPDFLRYVVSDMRTEITTIYEILRMIRDDHELQVPSSSFADGRTVAEVCDFLLERASNLENMLDVARIYADGIEEPPQTDDTND